MTPAMEHYGNTGGNDNVFAGSRYQRVHGIGSFLGGLFRRVLPYLARGARAVGKEALRAGVNIIEDVENNTPLKEAIKSRFVESRSNLKRKAKEKIGSLMTGTGYKSDAKRLTSQFPFNALAGHIADSPRRKRRAVRRKSSSKSSSRKSKKKKSSKVKTGRTEKKR